MEVTAGAVPVVMVLVLVFVVLGSGFVRLARGEAGREGGSWVGAVDGCGGVVSFVITLDCEIVWKKKNCGVSVQTPDL